MSSQFRRLGERVDRLESLVGSGSNKDKQRKAQAIDDAVSQIARQQKSAMDTLYNSGNASPEELRGAIPFLKTKGLQEQARYEADAKEQYKAFEMSLGAPLIKDMTLINNMRNCDPVKYQAMRAALSSPAQMQAPTVLPAAPSQVKTSKQSPNAMKAAQQLWNQSYEKNQEMMAPHRGPLNPAARNEQALMLPNPVNGVVI